MLIYEKAQEQLKTFQIEDGYAQCQARIKGLSSSTRDLGLRLLGKPTTRHRQLLHNLDYRARKALIADLERLNDGEKLELFTAFFPALGQTVANAFELQKALPYQTGYSRKAFRAPKLPAATAQARVQWLENLLSITLSYDPNLDLSWYAAWTPYLGYGADNTLGYLFAAAIECNDAAVYDILIASAKGEHPIGAMGRHVPRALLIANKPEAWDFVERLLVAAQRQEGLRQVILETVDEAHSEAFVRMLRLLSEEKLSRFAAVVRAVDVWFNLQLETAQGKKVDEVLAKVLLYLEQPDKRTDLLTKALNTEDAEDVYLALWAQAYTDAVTVVDLAKPLLEHSSPEIRYVTTDLLVQLGLSTSQAALVPLLDDPDLRIALRAWSGITSHNYDASNDLNTDMFERIERLLERTPKNKMLAPLVWDWTERTTSQDSVARSLLTYLGERPISRLMPHAKRMDSYGRRQIVDLIDQALKEKGAIPSDMHDALLAFVGDTSSDVRERALKVLTKLEPSREDIERLEPLLSRKAGDLRRGLITLITNQKDEGAVASAQRLLAASKAPLREAGLEVLRILKTSQRSLEQVQNLAETHAARSSHSQTESALLETLFTADTEALTLADGLGLFNPHDRSKPVTPQNKAKGLLKRGRTFKTDTAARLVLALDELVHTHRETPLQIDGYSEDREDLLGNLRYGIWQPFRVVWKSGERIYEKNDDALPLQELWEAWWQNRPKSLRDNDGLEALRTYASYVASQRHLGKGGMANACQKLFTKLERSKLRYEAIVVSLLQYFCFKDVPSSTLDFVLDAAETSLALVPKDAFEKWETFQKEQEDSERWYRRADLRESRLFSWFGVLKGCQAHSSHWTEAHALRYWHLLKTLDEGLNTPVRFPPDWHEALAAYKLGAASDADILEYLIGERDNSTTSRYVNRWAFRELRNLSGHKTSKILEENPQIVPLVNSVRDRVLEIELKRGDLPTPASLPTLALRSIYGADYVFRILKSLGKTSFLRGYSYDGLSKTAVFSGLLRSSFPAETDTLDAFKEKANEANVSEQRLLDLAVYAPQWSDFVCHALAWDGLQEAVYWLHAHTKDAGWTVDTEVREVWNAEVAERTPLKGEELLDGAVDVAWFSRVYNNLGAERWAMLDQAAKYASGGGGHKRAQLFADALLGQLSFDDLRQRINAKRHQDSVRAVGLLPLPEHEKQKKAEVLERYTLIQEFLRGRRKFGSQRQASEKLAATIGLENLARTADYADPQRLMWAMEAEAIRDLAAGPVSVSEGEVTVSLSLDDVGAPELSIIKNGKSLKNIPAKLKKHPKIAGLRERKNDLAKQTSRMRQSLEEAMNRGDTFTTSDFAELFEHPVLKPMLESLVFATEDGALGYPVKQGKALHSANGSEITLGKTSVRVAHPVDLLESEKWSHYQQEVFASERKQPFKQVFRELYVLTKTERETAKRSMRYEGHQVNPRQALALLGGRGWVTVPEEGVRRTFHEEGVSVWLEFLEGYYTPADVDGLTLSSIVFTKRGEWKPLKLEAVPPRVFSEAMRDLDLVVSVAHQGGVDPEASASTVEMRTSLLHETLGLLKLDNVRLERNHALIKGELGEYSVHLGSALVHRQPGGALCIIPVGSQHRGRLFLPFADDDPKTAEVMSKVLLLANDKQIQDPTILEQLR